MPSRRRRPDLCITSGRSRRRVPRAAASLRLASSCLAFPALRSGCLGCASGCGLCAGPKTQRLPVLAHEDSGADCTPLAGPWAGNFWSFWAPILRRGLGRILLLIAEIRCTNGQQLGSWLGGPVRSMVRRGSMFLSPLCRMPGMADTRQYEGGGAALGPGQYSVT